MKQGFLIAFLFLIVTGCVHFDLPVEELIPKYANERSQFIELDGMSVHYREHGKGPNLLLIHGTNSSLHTWEGWANELSSQFRVISLDLPGHGLTGPHPNAAYTWKEQAAFINNFMNALNIDRFSIAGNSMGGSIAWHYAVANPGKVEKLILIGSRGLPPVAPTRLEMQAFRIPVVNYLFDWFTPRFLVRSSLEDAYGNPNQVEEVLVDQYFELYLREGNREAARQRFNNIGDLEYTPKLKKLPIDTLIMWGAKDQYVPVKHAYEFEQMIPRSKLIIYSELGHIPMEEAPIRTAHDVKAFLLGGGR